MTKSSSCNFRSYVSLKKLPQILKRKFKILVLYGQVPYLNSYLIPCSAAARPERWPHPAATSWRRDEAAHASASLPLPSPSNLAPPPAARCLPPVGLLLPGSRLVDPARRRVGGPPNISTPMRTVSSPALSASCSHARDWLACLPCDLLPPQQQKYDYSPCFPLYFSLQVQQM